MAGVVRVVEPSAFLKLSALGVEEKRVNVIADFVDPWTCRQMLGDGFRIEARIVVASTPYGSLLDPAGTLFREQDASHVYRVADGVAKLRSVDVGETNDLQTEIKAGLSQGDVLVLHPTNKFREGVSCAQLPALAALRIRGSAAARILFRLETGRGVRHAHALLRCDGVPHLLR